jgi:sugar lactone lactonase YvrE
MLGGPDRQTLFIMAAEYPPAAPDKRTGQVVTVQAPAPGVGWP